MGSLLCFLPLFCLCAAERWYEDVLVGMEVGPTGAQFEAGKDAPEYARRFDGAEIVQASVKAGAEYLVIWVRDGEFTFHKSEHLPRPSAFEDRDVLRETVGEASKHDLPVVAYCQLQYPAHELRQHPDWRVRTREGNTIDHLVCFNSPYTNVVKTLITEMMSYGIDGFHLDMVDQGFGEPVGCWCERCQALFEEAHGTSMPKEKNWEDPNWHRMLSFRYETSDRLEKDLTSHIRSIDPEVTVDFNYHGSPPFSWEIGQTPVRHANNGDFVTGEAGQWAFGALAASFNAAWYRAATPGKPFQVAVQRGVRMYHDQTTRPLEDMRWEIFTLLAHGAFVTMIDKTAYDGWLDPVAYERIGELLHEARSKREHFGQEPVVEVGIYFSARTRDRYARDDPARYFQSVQGAHKACVYEHIGFGFLFDENVTLEALKQFPVVGLANTAVLTRREVDLFTQYVSDGGNLLVTGQAGGYDAFGRPSTNNTMSALIGARSVEVVESTDFWVRFDSDEDASFSERFAPDGMLDWPFLVMGPATVYQPTTAKTVGRLMNSHRRALANPGGYNGEWPLSANADVGPALLINRVGRGTVLTLAGSPDHATAGEHHIVEARRLFANAVRFLNPRPRVRVNAPSNVELIVTDDPTSRVLRLHFVGYNIPPQTTPAKNRPHLLPGLMETAPIYRASVDVLHPILSVNTLNASTEVLRPSETTLALQIEDTHEVIIIRY